MATRRTPETGAAAGLSVQDIFVREPQLEDNGYMITPYSEWIFEVSFNRQLKTFLARSTDFISFLATMAEQKKTANKTPYHNPPKEQMI